MLGIHRLFQKAAIISSDRIFLFSWEDALQALFFNLFQYSQIWVCIADAVLELGTNSEVVYNFYETNMWQSMVTLSLLFSYDWTSAKKLFPSLCFFDEEQCKICFLYGSQ